MRPFGVIFVHCVFNFLFYFQPVNMSVLSFKPEIRDHGKVLTCRAENPGLEKSAIQDSLLLKVHCKYFLASSTTVTHE